VIVRVDLAALARGRVESGEACEVAPGSPVLVSVAQRFIDDGAFVAAVMTEGEQVLGVAHFGRKPTAKQRTALEWLSPRCSVRGCDQAVRLEVDHRIDWAVTHHTRLGELDLLCDGHHLRKTREGWGLEHGHGRRRFLPPDHPDHPGGARPEHLEDHAAGRRSNPAPSRRARAPAA
jgi:hypothetical protein